MDSSDVEVPPSCPFIVVTVSADERPDTVTRLNYCVLLSGIKPDNRMIYIVRSLDNISRGKFETVLVINLKKLGELM